MNERDSGRHVSLSFPGDLPLREVLETTFAECGRLALAPPDEGRVCIILEELLANLYDHGGVGPGGAVRLALRGQPGLLHIVLEDSGSAFDPRHAQTATEMPERGGGVGLDLVRQWVEHLSYVAGSPLNRLELWIALQIEDEG